ncbi:MAG: threonine synthase [Oscillospiraceae bacterium]
MNYQSTRGGEHDVSAAQAIVKGLAGDKGLFVPNSIPSFTDDDLEFLQSCNYMDAAKLIFEMFLDDFSLDEIDECVEAAYFDSFDSASVTPVVTLDSNTAVLELWHGPTCAFKDVALQILPHLMTTSMKITGEKNEIVILVATSGDTGKAALEGFKDVAGTSIIVLYPQNGVSEIQKRQMVTQEGSNVEVIAINGNFDTAQNAVKSIFMDDGLAAKILNHGKKLSSANSINWGRLLPQIVYYAHTSARLLKSSPLAVKVNFVVPTGNFGNILACYYAKRMGAPIGRMICASNANNVLTDFIKTGVYNRNREFRTTMSPSMDILVSSNLERLLYELSDHDSALVSSLMSELAESGSYSVPDELKAKISELFSAGFCDDSKTTKSIAEAWLKYRYVMDPHTAVAFGALESYRSESGDSSLSVVVSTASPYKFPCGVYSAISDTTLEHKREYEIMQELSELTGWIIPEPVSELESREVLHSCVCEPCDIGSLIETLICNVP